MHLVLTDRLTCSRCGPTFGLILLADELQERRVHEGRLGCANCRDRYEIHRGFGDLRPAPRAPFVTDDDADVTAALDEAERAEAVLLPALLGLSSGPGHTVLVGRAVRWVHALRAELPSDAEFVAIDPETRHWPESEGVSRMACGEGLPFFDRSIRGVLLDGPEVARTHLVEAARIVAPRHRVVVLKPPSGAAEVLQQAGLRDLRETERVLAAGR